MRKLLTALLSVIAVCCVTAGVACGSHTHTYSEDWSSDATNHWHAATCEHEDETSDLAEHTFVATDQTDTDGNVIYQCSVCGYQHAHTYSTGWTSDKTAHWHTATCGHSGATSGYAAHDFEDGYCIVCGYDETDATEYQILFAYYTDDNESGTYGDTVTNSSGTSVSDTYRGVTYTAVNYNGIEVDIDGDYLYKGDVFAFTVTKSVFCHYTDSHEYPYVYANEDVVAPNSDGVYIVEVEGDTVITVGNVEQDDMTIGGTGIEDDPYTINSLVDWLYFANLINDKDWYGFSYNTAYWKLTRSLNFEGESIYIVGDGYTTDYSLFCGIFDGDNHTISNFTIDNAVYDTDSDYSMYVGVFGIVSGYTGVDTCIKNLNISNYTIDATAASDSIVAAGGVAGYVSGASVINCHIDGLTINITADEDYYSYGAGIIGVCQSSYSESEGLVFYSSVQYCSADVDINCVSGLLYAAGGIVARTFPASELASVYLFNNYSSGSYTGAARAGGIVGYAGRYTSVQNCYSTATIISASTDTNYVTGYEGTALDDRYSYAGGIVGYAENDTLVANCFYKDGSLNVSATAGSGYALKGDIVAGSSAAGFEDYRALAVTLLNNLTSSDTVSNDVLKNTLGWDTADWVFGDSGYPTTNTETVEHKFTVIISIDGAEADKLSVDSVYIPLSYWYIRENSEAGSGLSEYLTSKTSSTSHTYGYYFDAALTQRVPSCYVPMGNVTLYAGYADYSEVEGEYLIYSNGLTVTLTLKSDGTYTFEHDAVYLEGDYEYNGTYITMVDSYFSRLVSSATSTQQETYFTFWAEKNDNGDLEIYDCETTFEITSDFDTYGYTYLARLVSSKSPLVAVASAHTTIVGTYYVDGNTSNIYEFYIGYTGTYSQSGYEYSVSYSYDSQGNLTVTRGSNVYTATVENGKITKLTLGSTEYTLKAYDDFMGTWEQSATINKKYTFDGIENWTYYVDGDEVSSGKYEIENGELKFTRDPDGENVKVTVTLNSDGSLNVKESTGTVNVGYFAEGGYAGTWYTAAQQSGYYTMTLSGLNSNGIGLLNISGAGLSITDLRYLNDGGVLYAYDGDTLYAQLTYSTSDKTMTVLLYSSSTGSLDTELTFFLYDDFRGDWFTSISDGTNSIYKLTFNGLGLYNVDADTTANTMAVRGYVTIYYTDANGAAQSESVRYSNGTSGYTFTFKNVTYTISYDENNNIVSVSYGSTSATLIAGDSLYNVTYVDGDGYTYAFNGGGNTADGGTVVITTDGDTLNYYYAIGSDNKVTIYSDSIGGTVYATLTPVTENGAITGYTFVKNGATTSLVVSNSFTGTWAVYGGYITYTIPEITYFVSGSVTEITISYLYNGETGTIVGYYDGTVVWFSTGYTTYYINEIYGVMILGYEYDMTDADDEDIMLLYEYDGYLATYKKDDDNKVLLAGDSEGDEYGNAIVIIDGASSSYYYKVDADGNITIYTVDSKPEAVYTFNEATDGSYTDGTTKRELEEVTAD